MPLAHRSLSRLSLSATATDVGLRWMRSLRRPTRHAVSTSRRPDARDLAEVFPTLKPSLLSQDDLLASSNELPQGQPQAQIGGLAEEPDQGTAHDPAVARWPPAQHVIRERAHVVAEVVVAGLPEDGEPALPALVHEAEGQGPEGRQGGMNPHVTGLHAGSDDAVAAEGVRAVPAIAAERLAEHEGPADQLAEADDVEVRAGPEVLHLRWCVWQDHRQQGSPEHQGALRPPDPRRRVVLVVPERKEDALHQRLPPVLVPHLQVDAVRQVHAAHEIGMVLRQHLPVTGDGPLVGAGERDRGLDVVVNEEMSLDEAREQQVVGVEEDDELAGALAKALDLCAELADVPREAQGA